MASLSVHQGYTFGPHYHRPPPVSHRLPTSLRPKQRWGGVSVNVESCAEHIRQFISTQYAEMSGYMQSERFYLHRAFQRVMGLQVCAVSPGARLKCHTVTNYMFLMRRCKKLIHSKQITCFDNIGSINWIPVERECNCSSLIHCYERHHHDITIITHYIGFT